MNVSGYNSRNEEVVAYLNLTLANQSVAHGSVLPVPPLPQSIDEVLQFSLELNESQQRTDEFECSSGNLKPHTVVYTS